MDKMKKGGKGGGSGPGFIDTVKSGEFLDNLKQSFEQLKGGNRQVLPEELQKKMEELDKQANAFVEAQKKAEEEAMNLKRLTAALCSDAIAMYTPPAEGKSAKPAEEAAKPAAAPQAEATTPPATEEAAPAAPAEEAEKSAEAPAEGAEDSKAAETGDDAEKSDS